ncbi:MAG: tetratricopeptide repeat protein [Limisphaerales bacterium]
MNAARTFFLLLIALLVLCFGLAADLEPQFRALENSRHQSDNFFSLLLGDSSRIFANSTFVEADAYYHSGFYPTIFDNNEAFRTPHMAEDTGAVASHNQGEETSFMGPPRDWIDAFGRHFVPNRHTHLDQGGPTDDLSKSKEVREILPWLKLSAELDPENVRTYVVTAYWLRTRLNQVAEAAQVLREGLRHNPGNPQLLFELGRIYFENYHDPARARNIWEAALRSWAREAPGVPPSERLKLTSGNADDIFIFEQLQTYLAELEEKAGNRDAAIARWEQVKPASPNPGDIQKRIDELKQKSASH